jgi:CDP-2,3-bis-(O-geranylgeranyl)-sn-glycerol synthase
MNDIILFLLSCMYLMLPAYISNMSPLIGRKFLPLYNKPLDFHLTFRKKRIFGNNKSIGGILTGIIAGTITCFIQHLIQNNNLFLNITYLNYSNWLIIGLLLSFGALAGDFIKSFFKRQIEIKPGKKFIPFDQIDFSIGALLFLSFSILLPIKMIITIIILSFILHIITNHISFYLGIRKEKW